MSFLMIHKLGNVDLATYDFRLRSFTGYEELSRLYVFQLRVDFLEGAQRLPASSLPGMKIVFSVDSGTVDTNGAPVRRFFSGIASRFWLGGLDATNTRRMCHVEVVPPLWTLTEIFDCRRFPPQKVSALVDQLLLEAGLAAEVTRDFRPSSSDDPRRTRFVQYDETTMNFLGRVIEDNNFFFFLQEQNRTNTGGQLQEQPLKLVLGNRLNHYEDLQLTLDFQGAAGGPTTVTCWEPHYQYRPSRWMAQAYDYGNSRAPNTTRPVARDVDLDPSTSGNPRKFQRATRLRTQQQADDRLDSLDAREATEREYTRGECGCPLLYPGALFSLANDPYGAAGGPPSLYVTTAVEHRAVQYDDNENQLDEYTNGFICVPHQTEVVFHCPRGATARRSGSVTYPGQQITRRPGSSYEGRPPVASNRTGLGTSVAELAVVVDSLGASTDEGKTAVWNNNHNDVDHIYVRYRWDTDADWHEEDRRVRVAQPWAGSGWGTKFLPRIGQEVVVLFVNGDPDSPHNVVLGTLSNDQHRFPTPSAQPQMQTVKRQAQSRAFPDRDGGYLPKLGNRDFPHVHGSTEQTEPVNVPHLSADHVAGIRTRSSDQANANVRHNELLFDDTHGGEQVYMHAARDLNIQVDRDLNIEVRGDKKEVIRGNYYQVVCVGNIGPQASLSPTPTTRGSEQVQEQTYPPASGQGDDVGPLGVFRGVTDGVSFDVDKVIGTKSVEFVRKEGDNRVWREKTETYVDTESRHKGDSVSVNIGHTDSYQYEGNAFSLFGGSEESVTLGNSISIFLGGKQSLSMSLLDLNVSFTIDVGIAYAAKCRREWGPNLAKKIFDYEDDDVKLKRTVANIEQTQSSLVAAAIQVQNNTQAQIRKLNTDLSEVNTKLSKAKIVLEQANVLIHSTRFQIVKSATITFV